MSKIKVWQKELLCHVCGGSDWSHTMVRIEVGNIRIGEEVRGQSRYLFSCNYCGLEQLFGKIYDWDIEEQNIEIID
ncbi:hypothetical protein Back11_59980 [Paenibacillus baekrokdamisoli]|uniref:Uncharacterized protein n=1 Tax=Paenibacillus baekrokdamisoli TaxID=1712516 RepID=A0A3G9JI75_9BACL|nr:hypothetical protein [Paenibacillus baekrokdamisoli]MBB3071309.1 hypothetical protein [Paenibacillus baekrokdamisoli]BBH24653.1 hypothetical protein Back11_59980 [Paenibacillus baekrokdamisoli]